MSSVKSKSVEVNGAAAPALASTEQKPKLKACCACPETKKLRDEWYGNGESLGLY